MEFVKKFYLDRISKPLMDNLLFYNVNPNLLTWLNHIMTLTIGVWFFSRGTWWGYIGGVVICLINVVIDYADGDLAVKSGKTSEVGEWYDCKFDIIIQATIMGAIGLGCIKQGLLSVWVVLYFVSNIGLNLVSFYYNNKFGFDSRDGSDEFRKWMDQKPTVFNRFIKNIIDPVSSAIGLGLYTVRYWIVLGCFIGNMPLIFICITILGNMRWIIMYIIFALHLKENIKLWVSQVLANMDTERPEHYAVRDS